MKEFRAKKYLGQNFLKSDAALRKIVGAGEVKPGDIILEIGPGKGALTEKLVNSGGQTLAVEKDGELFEFLKIKFGKEIEQDKLNLIHDDILHYDISKWIDKNSKYKIMANIPYNITGAILKKFLTTEHQPEKMVLLVQKEVAERIVARDGKESILSISVKAYGKPQTIMKVPKRYFSPAPKVDSAVIEINEISRKFFIENGINEEKFWQIVKNAFSHKRKVLKSNLKGVLPDEVLASLGNKRAENLTLRDWIALTR